MKKSILLSLVFCSTAISLVRAQFQFATFPEIQSFAHPDSIGHVNHMSAYSMKSLIDFSGNVFDINIHTWNQKGGLGWVTTAPGNPSFIYQEGVLSEPFQKVYSISAAVVINSITGYNQIVVGYSDLTGAYLQFYDILGAWGGISLSASYVLSTNNNVSMINVDAVKGYAYAVVWGENGLIKTLAGRTDGGGPLFGCINTFDPLMGGSPDKYMNPDVAIGYGSSFPSSLGLHYVFTNVGGGFSDKLLKVSIDFDYINNNCPLLSALEMPIVDDILYASGSSTFSNSQPRIDCPDIDFGLNDWSYIIGEYNPGPPFSRVIAGRLNSNISSIPSHFILNDGSMASIGMIFPAVSSTMYGDVAYEQDGTSVYFAWPKTMSSPALGAYDFLALQLDMYDSATTSDYMVIDFDPTITRSSPIIALAQNSDMADYFFMAYQGINSFTLDYGTYFKFTKWMNFGFKEESMKIESLYRKLDFQVYPNPFRASITLAHDGIESRDELVVKIIDIKGAIVKSFEGTLLEVNQKMNNIGADLSDNMYHINVLNKTTQQMGTKKLVKY